MPFTSHVLGTNPALDIVRCRPTLSSVPSGSSLIDDWVNTTESQSSFSVVSHTWHISERHKDYPYGTPMDMVIISFLTDFCFYVAHVQLDWNRQAFIQRSFLCSTNEHDLFVLYFGSSLAHCLSGWVLPTLKGHRSVSLVWPYLGRIYGQFNQPKSKVNAPFNTLFLVCKYLTACSLYCGV